MSNIVVDADSQESSAAVEENVEISNIDESTITDSVEDIQSEVVDNVSEETQTEAPEIPSKFAGKSTEDIIDSYTNLEKELGRKAQDVGD